MSTVNNKKIDKKKRKSTGSIPDNGLLIQQILPCPKEMVKIRYNDEAARDSDRQEVLDSQESAGRFNLHQTPRNENITQEDQLLDEDIPITGAEFVVDETGSLSNGFEKLMAAAPEGNYSLEDAGILFQQKQPKGEKEKFRIPKRPKAKELGLANKRQAPLTRVGRRIPVISKNASTVSSASTVPIIINPCPKLPPGYTHCSPQQAGATRFPQQTPPPAGTRRTTSPPTLSQTGSMGRFHLDDEEVPDIDDQDMWDEVNSVLDRSMDESWVGNVPGDDLFGSGLTGRQGATTGLTHDNNANIMGMGMMISGAASATSAFGIEAPKVEDLFDQDQLAALAAFPAAALGQLREVEIATAVNERKSTQGKQFYY